jgi:putative hydrolase of the HAD superfamily
VSRDLGAIDAWIFDLDDTLYPRDQGVMRLIEKRMNAFMITATGLDPEAALVLQKRFLHEHGTTLAGLMANYAIDPQAFLDDVHDVPLDSLEPNPTLAALIAGLPGKKVVFTNGARGHADRVMARVGLSDLFDDVFAIEDADLLPKPAPATYHRLVARNAIDPRRAVFFEDTPRNLATGHEMGMTTVLVGRPDVAPVDFIDYHTPLLADFLEALPFYSTAP